MVGSPTGEAIGTAQYNTWRANYGASLPVPSSSENAAVPEPAAGLLAAVLLLVMAAAGQSARRPA